jgi:hypothetical protein
MAIARPIPEPAPVTNATFFCGMMEFMFFSAQFAIVWHYVLQLSALITATDDRNTSEV